MSIKARWSGTCPECGERWQPDDPIRSVVVGHEHVERWVHDRCPNASDPLSLRPGETVCPDCWLVHPEGACDR